MEAPGAAVLQKGRNLTVRTILRLADGTDAEVVIKRFPPPSPLRICLNAVRGVKGKAMRSYLASKHLFDRNRDSTPEPICAVESGNPKAPGESCDGISAPPWPRPRTPPARPATAPARPAG